jgi:hypothetical protein
VATSARPPQDPAPTAHAPAPFREREARSDDGTGWVAFAGAFLLVAGCMHVIWGIVALDNKSAFHEDGLVWSNLNTWGWIAIGVGAAQVLGGLLVLGRQFAGQWMAGILALLGIFANFLAVGAYPLWSLLALGANALVLWAVTAHGDEFDD